MWQTSVIFVICLLFISVKTDGFQSTLGHVKPKTDAITQKNAVEDLIKRLIPERASQFVVEIIPNFGPVGRDTFKIEKSKNIIKISASSGVAAAWGFHHYLKYFCKAHVSWETVQLNLPKDLPDVNLTISSNDRFRYYQNVCTTSYSFVWWTEKDWEKHIDWMAMNSINLVLAFNGQEAIWQRVYKKLGLTDEDIDEHFAGPAFLSWSRMGNMRGWGGPLSENWHKRSLILQKYILQKMRNLGITPVLPAFAGHVPKAFKRLFPNAKMRLVGSWNDFGEKYCCPFLLDPTDTLFKKVGNMFMTEQISEFGTDHIYNCDTFNEMTPSTNDTKYLQAISKSIFSAMTDVDPKAIWLMQGWLFINEEWFWTKKIVKDFVTAVPMGRMVILDLQSERFPQYTRFESYFGQPFIWCMLHNFGGTLGMFGSADKVNTGVFQGRAFENSTMIGTGLTPEGINQNYVIYDLMNEMAWRKKPANLTIWMSDYATRRYGQENKNATAAWQILKDTLYSYNIMARMRGKYVITRTPRLNISPLFWYNTTKYMGAWDLLLDASDELKNNSGYLHDLVDVTRQSLQIFGDIYYNDLINSFHSKDVTKFQEFKTLFNQLFIDLELILSTNEAFLLGRWLEAAKSAASTPEEAELFELNARNQITLWGPKGEIENYANKQWAGVMSNFFGPRWEFFMSAMNISLITGKTFNESYVLSRIFNEIEIPFNEDRTIFPTTARGDSIEIAKQIYIRWRKKVKNNISKRKRPGRNHRKNSKDILH